MPPADAPLVRSAADDSTLLRTHPLRILQVVEATFAGVGRHVMDLCKALLARGHEVHLAYSPLRMEGRFERSMEELSNLVAYRIEMPRCPSLLDGRVILELRRYLRKHGPFDVVHGHSSKGGAIARLASHRSARRVYTAHAFRTLDPQLGLSGRLIYGMAERVLGQGLTDAFIAVSKEEAEEARRLGIGPDRAHVVPNGIEPPNVPGRAEVRTQLGLTETSICLMWVGRLGSQKAPDRFVRLLARLVREAPEVQGLMIGSGPLEVQIRALISEHGLSGNLRLMQDDHAARYMPAADVFALTSRYEGLPYVLLEAQSLGVPVVAFEVGGLSSAIEPGVTGFTCGQAEEDRYLDALRRLIKDPDLRAAMGHAARQRARQFGLDLMVDRIEALYRSPLGSAERYDPSLLNEGLMTFRTKS